MEQIKGKRTYIIIGVGIAYLVGVKYGLWPADQELIAGLGFAAVAFLRAGMKASRDGGEGGDAK